MNEPEPTPPSPELNKLDQPNKFDERKPSQPTTRLGQFVTEVIRTATSKERLKALFRISLYRNAIYIMADQAVIAIVGFVFWVVAARFYGTADVGFASATISAMSLLALLSTLGLDYGLIRFLPNAGNKSNIMINTCLTIGGLVSIILAVIFLAGLGFWSAALLPIREHWVFSAAFVVFTAAATLLMLVMGTFIAARRAGFLVARDIILSLVKLALLIPLAVFPLFGVFASWGIGLIVSLGITVLLFVPRVQAGYRPFFIVRREALRDMVHFSCTNYIAVLLWMAPALILPLMVANRLGTEDNAYFYITWSIATILFAIPASTSLSLFAEGSSDEQRLSQDTRRSLKFAFVVIVPSMVLIFLIASRVLLLFGEDYSENGTKLLWLLTFSALPLSLNYIYFSMKRVQMKMKVVMGLTGFIAAATLGLSYILLPRMGILGAGVAWLASQGVVAVFVIGSFFVKSPRRGSKVGVN